MMFRNHSLFCHWLILDVKSSYWLATAYRRSPCPIKIHLETLYLTGKWSDVICNFCDVKTTSLPSAFFRLELAGNEAIILTSQYRFHPSVTSLMNAVFYNGKMRDGVCGEERSRLVEGLPNLCFYDVPGVETPHVVGCAYVEAANYVISLTETRASK